MTEAASQFQRAEHRAFLLLVSLHAAEDVFQGQHSPGDVWSFVQLWDAQDCSGYDVSRLVGFDPATANSYQ